MPTSLILAFDVGTSGVKGVLTDLQGQLLESEYRPYAISTHGDGWVDQDFEEIWQATCEVARQLAVRSSEKGYAIVAISVAAQMFNVVPVDLLGNPLTPMLSWLDQRADLIASNLLLRIDRDEQFDLLGSVVSAKDILPKILWLIENEPKVIGRTWKFLDCKEAVVLRLTGRAVTDYAGASSYRLFDTASRAWSENACIKVGILRDWLPDIESATAVAGPISDSVANLLGIATEIPVMVGAGDVPASQVGSGAVDAGDVHLSLGTAIYFGISLTEPRLDPKRQLGVLGHMDPQKWILWLEIATGGAALTWVARLLGLETSGHLNFSEIDRSVLACADEMDSLLFAPWLSGERVPLFDDQARAAFIGLGLNHGPGHLLRAVMEGVAFQMRWALEYGENFGQNCERVRAVGGGTMGHVWLQIMANVLDRPIEVIKHSQDAGAIGAAACAIVGIGKESNFDFVRDLVRVERVLAPDAESSATYKSRYQNYRDLYEALQPIYKKRRLSPEES